MPQPKKPKKVGRPKLPKGHAKGRVLDLRLTNEEIRKFTLAAKKTGLREESPNCLIDEAVSRGASD